MRTNNIPLIFEIKRSVGIKTKDLFIIGKPYVLTTVYVRNFISHECLRLFREVASIIFYTGWPKSRYSLCSYFLIIYALSDWYFFYMFTPFQTVFLEYTVFGWLSFNVLNWEMSNLFRFFKSWTKFFFISINRLSRCRRTKKKIIRIKKARVLFRGLIVCPRHDIGQSKRRACQ